MQLVNEETYRALVNQAREFRDALKDLEIGYTDPQMNRVALETMLIGWLRAQPVWDQYDNYCAEHHPRENLWPIAGDSALQAAQDVIGNDPFFGGSQSAHSEQTAERTSDEIKEARWSLKQLEEYSAKLLSNIKQHLPELEKLLAEVDDRLNFE